MRSRLLPTLIWLTLGMLVVNDVCPTAAGMAHGEADNPLAVAAAAKDRTWNVAWRIGRIQGSTFRKHPDSPFVTDAICEGDAAAWEFPVETGGRISRADTAADRAARGMCALHLRI